MIFCAGGLPNPEMFPFIEAEFTLGNGEKLQMDMQEMCVALQYGPSKGDPELIELLKNITREFHNPPTLDSACADGRLDLLITSGAQDALSKCADMLIAPGDNVIIEAPFFSGSVEMLKAMDCNILTVETDKDGMKPDLLRKVLSPWQPEDCKNPNSSVPRVLFSIPNGCNPSGASLTIERKKEIYQIAREYDILIVEDDPYYFLQYEKPVPSFLSMDTDGRVIRIDSFSKTIAPGLRLGYMSGPRAVLRKAELHCMVTTLQPSSLSQRLVLAFLKKIGMEGFKARMKKIQQYYKNQKEAMSRSLEKWLKDYCEWDAPSAGMFYWVKINCLDDTWDLIEKRAFKKEVMVVHGEAFYPDNHTTSTHFRVSFAFNRPEVSDKAMERLAEAIKEELQLRKEN